MTDPPCGRTSHGIACLTSFDVDRWLPADVDVLANVCASGHFVHRMLWEVRSRTCTMGPPPSRPACSLGMPPASLHALGGPQPYRTSGLPKRRSKGKKPKFDRIPNWISRPCCAKLAAMERRRQSLKLMKIECERRLCGSLSGEKNDGSNL
jgi:hypothetical protein